MEYTSIAVSRAGAVGLIHLADPATLNAMDVAMVEQIDAALDELAGQVRCLIVGGKGRAFCSGGKLEASGLAASPAPDQIDVGATLESHVNPLLGKLRALPIPWIAAVRGAAAGVGCALALAADMVIASDTAYFLQAFSRIGLVPDGGSSFLLTRTIGRVRALEMMLLGERLPAKTALDWGLVNRVVADDDLDAVALELAARLADGPTRTLGMIRNLAWQAADTGWDDALAAERRSQRVAGRTSDFREGVLAFAEKRAPRFTGA